MDEETKEDNVTPEELKAKSESLAHIPLHDMEQDLMDTEREILQLEEEIKHLETTPKYMQIYKMNIVKAGGKRQGIKERQEFCLKLQELIAYRKQINLQ